MLPDGLPVAPVENSRPRSHDQTVATVASRQAAKGKRNNSAPQVRARFYVPFVLAVALLGASFAFNRFIPQGSVAPKGPGSSGALNWSNGIFANRDELKAWLNAHGKSYKTWAKQHPAALKLIPEK
jgi:hypothetical protein